MTPKSRPCGYCGKLCDPVAGNPSLWPLYFPDPDQFGTGEGRDHHVGCVIEKIQAGDRAAALTAELLAALGKIAAAPLTIAASPDVISAVQDFHEIVCEIANSAIAKAKETP